MVYKSLDALRFSYHCAMVTICPLYGCGIMLYRFDIEQCCAKAASAPSHTMVSTAPEAAFHWYTVS